MANPKVLTVLAMLAFAANPLICRLALGQQLIDAASFTFVRIVSGAVTARLPKIQGLDAVLFAAVS